VLLVYLNFTNKETRKSGGFCPNLLLLTLMQHPHDHADQDADAVTSDLTGGCGQEHPAQGFVAAIYTSRRILPGW
jgi:hypothetical protein